MSELATQEKSKEFSNQELHLLVYFHPACRIEYLVKASASLIEKGRQRALKKIKKEVSLPGFRQGKAPDSLIQKKYGVQIEKELHNTLAEVGFEEAQKLAQIKRLNQSSRITFDIKKLTSEEAELSFQFETEPSVPSPDGSLFKPNPVEKSPVGEKEIHEALYQAQFFFAQWKEVERPIQDKDYLIIDLDTLDTDPPTRVFNQIRFEVSPERMAKWMYNLVLGAKTGDVLEGLSQPDDTASEQEKQEFSPKKVRVSVLKTEEATLPPLDDAFAQKLGTENVEKMRESVAKMLNAKAEEKQLLELREQASSFLLEQYPFELPTSLIQEEVKYRKEHLMTKSKEEWNKLPEQKKKEAETQLIHEAQQSIRLFYLSRQVVDRAQIPISHQEIESIAIKLLSEGRMPQKIDEIPRETWALAYSKLLLAKAQDYLLAQAKTLT